MEREPVPVQVVLEEGAQIPAYQSSGAAAMDLHATEAFALAPMERRSVGTGVRIAIPPGYEGQVRPRSGLAARHGISMVNTPGTIDSDYRGEIRVLLINLGHESVSFNQGDRIAQLAIVPVARADMRVVLSLDCTDRGESGFGSTGV